MRTRLAAGLAVPLLVLLPAAAAQAAPVDDAASALEKGPGVYVDPQVTSSLSVDWDRVRDAVEAAGTPVFIAALPDANKSATDLHLHTLIDDVGKKGTYVVVGSSSGSVADDLPKVSAAQAWSQAVSAHGGDRTAILLDFVDAVRAEAGSSSSGSSGSSGGGGGTAAGVLVGGIVVLGGGAGLLALRASRRRRRQEAEAFAEVHGAAEEDVTALGEDIARLDVPDSADDATRTDYTGALDAYDRAKQALAASTHVAELQAVTSALEEGRWRMECVRARLAGKPVPERLPPCFFDPRHGPSVTQVSWAPAGGAAREVPVCQADADRIARGEDPQTRQVLVQGSPVPYWNAGPAYAGYSGGFYGGWGGGGFLSGLLLGEVLSGGGGWGGYGYGPGWGGGYAGDGGAGSDGGNGGGDFASGFDFGGSGWGGDSGAGDSGGGGFDFGGGGGGDFGGGGGDSGGGGSDGGGGW
ncbi:hypothetical protein [Motilibacter rhizosphaerae]|uniref:hypothetical protein n=1 Tax=Motilibacter rhizosphaerae TaxID=598652 RepID=UPI0013EE6C95|nr:hypothetical protein [Motilibacter rhizosphaerae]